jgi:hypothetical protein
VTSDDFGRAQDYRAARAMRVLDRNDSHRFWFSSRRLIATIKLNGSALSKAKCVPTLFKPYAASVSIT